MIEYFAAANVDRRSLAIDVKLDLHPGSSKFWMTRRVALKP